MKDSVELGLTVDERIADGYYYAKSIRLLKKLLDNPELLERPYYVEANMSKYLASIIDIINHDVSVEKVRSSNEKIMSLMEKVNSR